jgi:hypothetical protein
VAAEAIHRHDSGRLSTRATGETGGVGRRLGAELDGLHSFSEGLYDVSSRISVFDWRSDTRRARSATSFSYVLGLGYRPYEAMRTGVEWDHAMNDLVGQRFRLVVTLELEVR